MGVGAVLIRDGKVLLIRRGKEPLRGRWTVPGGTVELGESLEQALVREMREETGLVVRALEPLAILEQAQGHAGRVLNHYVIVDFLCHYVAGSALAASDAEAVAWVSRRALPAYRLTGEARQVVVEAFRRTSVSSVSSVAPQPR